MQKHVKIVKMHEFFSLGVQISRFCANSAKFCAVARPCDRNIKKLWGDSGLMMMMILLKSSSSSSSKSPNKSFLFSFFVASMLVTAHIKVEWFEEYIILCFLLVTTWQAKLVFCLLIGQNKLLQKSEFSLSIQNSWNILVTRSPDIRKTKVFLIWADNHISL